MCAYRQHLLCTCVFLLCLLQAGTVHCFETAAVDAGTERPAEKFTEEEADLPSHWKHQPDHRASNGGVAWGLHDEMRPVAPFIVHDAIVTGPATTVLQGEYDESLHQGPYGIRHSEALSPKSRKLLHGFRNPRRFPRCGACLAVRCSGNSCTGHCRQRGQLFDCQSSNGSLAQCKAFTLEEFVAQNRPPDRFPTDESVVLTAAAPFIGCMVSADRPTGCPPPGTPATTDFGNLRDTITIVNSTCLTPPFVPNCQAPFLPFGVCLCEIEIRRPDGGSLVRPRACLTTVWPIWTGEVDADNEIVVEAREGTTHTSFSDERFPGQEPRFSYTLNVSEHFNGFDFPGFEGATVTQDVFTTMNVGDMIEGANTFSESDTDEHDALSGTDYVR